VAALISETEESIALADTTANAERVKALDLSASPDPVKARAAMENAVFIRDRLRTVLPRLYTRLKQIEAAEYLARWEPEYKRVIARRDALAAEMREVYPAAVAQLADLFQRAAQCNREISQLDQSAPSGDRRGIRGVELTARGVEALLQPDVWIAEMLRLPALLLARGRYASDLALSARARVDPRCFQHSTERLSQRRTGQSPRTGCRARTDCGGAYGAGESNPLSFAGPNSAPEQLLVWSIGLGPLRACQIPREREPK
jgi:hypothetical protein